MAEIVMFLYFTEEYILQTEQNLWDPFGIWTPLHFMSENVVQSLDQGELELNPGFNFLACDYK